MFLNLNEVDVIDNNKEANLIVIKSRQTSKPEEQKERLSRYVAKLVEWEHQRKVQNA